MKVRPTLKNMKRLSVGLLVKMDSIWSWMVILVMKVVWFVVVGVGSVVVGVEVAAFVALVCPVDDDDDEDDEEVFDDDPKNGTYEKNEPLFFAGLVCVVCAVVVVGGTPGVTGDAAAFI